MLLLVVVPRQAPHVRPVLVAIVFLHHQPVYLQVCPDAVVQEVHVVVVLVVVATELAVIAADLVDPRRRAERQRPV